MEFKKIEFLEPQTHGIINHGENHQKMDFKVKTIILGDIISVMDDLK